MERGPLHDLSGSRPDRVSAGTGTRTTRAEQWLPMCLSLEGKTTGVCLCVCVCVYLSGWWCDVAACKDQHSVFLQTFKPLMGFEMKPSYQAKP